MPKQSYKSKAKKSDKSAQNNTNIECIESEIMSKDVFKSIRNVTKKFVSRLFKGFNKQWIDSKEILRSIKTINLTFLPILLAFYIAIVAYFIPQTHQIKLNRELEFNHMLSELNNIIPGYTKYEDYPQYYNNDTIDINKISNAIRSKSLFAGEYYVMRNKMPLYRLTEQAMEYTDTLKLINLICSNPILNLSKKDKTHIYRGIDYVPFNLKLYHDIDELLRGFHLRNMIFGNDDMQLFLFCSESMFYGGSNGVQRILVTFSELDSLKNGQLLNPLFKNKSHIDFLEELFLETKNERILLSGLYENIQNILDTYNVEIKKMNFKIMSLENMVFALNGKFLIYSIILIFIMNILVPILLSNIQINGKLSLIYMLIGFLPYIFIIKRIIDYTQSVI